MPEQLVEGWTEPIVQQLLNNRRPFNATGMTIALTLTDRGGKVVRLAGTATWKEATTSVAQFAPGGHDLRAAGSPYEVRWTITAGGKHASYPNGLPDVWVVRR